MPDLSFNYEIVHPAAAISNLSVVESTDTNCIVSVDTDGISGSLWVFSSPNATPLDPSVIRTSGTELTVSGAGTYQLDSDVGVVPGSTRYYNVVHFNIDTPSNVLSIEVTAPAEPDEADPFITLNGEAEMDVYLGEAFVDPGAVVFDNVDEPRSISATSGTVDTAVLGTYYLYYDATDTAGNIAQQEVRTVNVINQVQAVAFDYEIEYMGFDVVAFEPFARGDSGLITIQYARVVPTNSNFNIAGLTTTGVTNNGDGTYDISFDCPADLPAKNGTVEFDVSLDNYTHKAQASVLPQDGWSYVDLLNPRRVNGYVFYGHENDAPETGGQVEWLVLIIQEGLSFAVLEDGQASFYHTDSANTDDVVLTEPAVVQLRYIAPDGEIARTAVVSYSMSVATVAPTINAIGGTSININQGEAFSYPAWTWSDDAVSDQPIAAEDWSGSIDVNTVGSYTLTASATNAVGTTTEDLTVTVNAVVVNTPATGDVVINGVLEQGETLTSDVSSIADADGLGGFSFQWMRDGVPINGAIASSYTLVVDDVDALISLRVSFTDGQGNLEQIDSLNIGPISAPTGPSIAPVIHTVGGTSISINENDPFTDPAWTWSDDIVTAQAVQWSGAEVDSSTPGSYERTASATNDVATTTATLTVTVNAVSIGLPVISGPGPLVVRLPSELESIPSTHTQVATWLTLWTAVDGNGGALGVSNDLAETLLVENSPIAVRFTAIDGEGQIQTFNSSITLAALSSVNEPGLIEKGRKRRFRQRGARFYEVQT